MDQFDRPLITKQNYTKTPQYIKHGSSDDRLAILVCRIKTWQPHGNAWFDIPTDNYLVIREVESIEVSDSYKNLVGKAVVRFPRGTIVEKKSISSTLISTDSGNGDGTYSYKDVGEATQNGDYLSYDMNPIKKNGSNSKTVNSNGGMVVLDGASVDVGLTNMNKHLNEKSLLSTSDFSIGNRIEIYLGYAYSEAEFNSMQSDNRKVPINMELAFTGFITSCSASTPIEIECSNMAHVLTTVNVPDITIKKTLTIMDFLDDNGRFHLLKDTGIKLSSHVGDTKIEVSKIKISSNLTVADVLNEWQKCGIMSYMENNPNGTSTLVVGKVYYAGKGGHSLPNNDKSYITYNQDNRYNIIHFDWDVAADGLRLINSDKKYLAVNAQGRTKDGWIKFTIRKTDTSSDDWQVSEGDDFSVVNEKMVNRRRGKKRAVNKSTSGTSYSRLKNKIDLSNYTVIPYISQTLPCTKEKLLEEAKQYWAKYVPNGISGTLKIFGDLIVRPSDIVGIIDPRQPQKNGYYLVESVSTSFGIDGFRKELKLPYKVASFEDYPIYML